MLRPPQVKDRFGFAQQRRPDLNLGDVLELEAGPLAYGRSAVCRHQGRVVFVERVAPGDRLRAEVTALHTSYAEARLLELLEAGTARVEAPCPIVEECGGCPWQHVAYDEQCKAKEAALRDCLTRIAGISDPPVSPIIASPQTEEYRNRIKLRFDGRKLGFYRAQTHSVVEVDNCLIAEPRLRSALLTAATFARALDTQITRLEIVSRGKSDGVFFAVNSRGRLKPADAARAKELIADRAKDVRGVTMWGRGWRRSWGETDRRTVLRGATLTGADPSTAADLGIDSAGSAFGQINTRANEILVREVQRALDLDPGDTLLELYAGSGNFSLPIAAACRKVRAIETDVAACEAGRQAAARHGIRNVAFTAERAEETLERLVAKAGTPGAERMPDAVLVDPPRNGLGKCAAAIARLGAPKVVYVSCNPATLARDIKVLRASGYELQSACPIDLFPHTFHVEAVCTLKLT